MRTCWKCKGAGAGPMRWCARCCGAGAVRDLEVGDVVVFHQSRSTWRRKGFIKWEVEARGRRWGADTATLRAIKSGARRTANADRLDLSQAVEDRLAEELMS